MVIARRAVLAVLPAALVAGRGDAGNPFEPSLADAIAAAERASRGRFGLAIQDTASGQRFTSRGGERFAMASTFKFLLTAAVLQGVDHGRERLDRTIHVSPDDVLPNSPLVEKRVDGPPPTVAELCEAAIIFSDNAAANLLLPSIGGPAGLTRFIRQIGDPVTRLDRTEPALNRVAPGDPRDTTTPDAMIANLRRILIGNVLSPVSRQRITDWMIDNRTGGKRLRAGMPASWRIGDKTGSWNEQIANDIAIAWPDGRAAPVLIAAYTTGGPGGSTALDATIAAVAKAITAAVGTH